MDPLSDQLIRASFVNCSKGEANRIRTPRDLDQLPWEDLDFLGWRDPGAPDRGYLVAPVDGRLIGVTLRAPVGLRRTLTKTNLCSLCLTSHGGTGVALLSARRAGAAGREGNTVGTYVCADLSCSLYVRGRKRPTFGERVPTTLSEEEQILQLQVNLADFVAQVLA
ncbi:FBP domain-containing protein [Streptacidiphilus monticola]|uniref:FBP domain-containing protein n=1 Tax=Streptacidiphilus monticola TaxID=2161674 RepID=A0ABW1G2V3_9ACTN